MTDHGGALDELVNGEVDQVARWHANIASQLAELPDTNDLSMRPGPGEQQLVYYDGHTVITLLNHIFGWDGWNTEVKGTPKVDCWQEGKSHKAYAQVVLRLSVVGVGGVVAVYREEAGAGSLKLKLGTKQDSDKGKAMENALKEAFTDALKRCARTLGPKTGLALYNKKFLGLAKAKIKVNTAAALEVQKRKSEEEAKEAKRQKK